MQGRPRLPAGERGEIAIRTVCNFHGYWNDPTATRAAFTADGYFRTGDIGYLDEDGYLFIVDRKKDIIIRGGENISCQEVEAAIYEHPAVAEAAVFGLPDERLGEVPGAVVHLRTGEALTSRQLLRVPRRASRRLQAARRALVRDEPLPRLGTEQDRQGRAARRISRARAARRWLKSAGLLGQGALQARRRRATCRALPHAPRSDQARWRLG